MKSSEAIKELRRRLDFTQQQLAFETGLSIRGIAGYETETRKPEPAPLVRLATVAARAGHHDLAFWFVSELVAQLRLDDISTGLLRPASGQRPGLLLLAFQDPAFNDPAIAFFQAASRFLWGREQAREEAREILERFNAQALMRWGKSRIIYRETEDGVEYQASDGSKWKWKWGNKE